MIKRRSLLIYLFGLPCDIAGVLCALALAPFQHGLGLRLERRPDGLGLWVLTLDVRHLPGEYAAVTISPHVIFYRTGRHFAQGWSVLQEHEHARCERHESVALVASLLALGLFASGLSWWIALVVWVPAPWLFMLAGLVVSWLRGGDSCRGSRSDEAAYALAVESRK